MGQESNCVTNPTKHWICKGSSAWKTGFLVDLTFVSKCKENELKVTKELPACLDLAASVTEVQKQREDCFQKRNALLNERDALAVVVENQSKANAALQSEIHELKLESKSSFSLSTVVLAVLTGGAIGWAGASVYNLLK